MVITFCGHSDYLSNSKDEKRLLNFLEKVIKQNRVDFYLGGYGNFDGFAFRCAKKYKESHPDTKIIFVTPYLDGMLNKGVIKESYDAVIYPDLEFVPKRFAIIKRNEWMIEKADYVFAYVKRHYGGAYRTLLYAKKRKKAYINLYKENYELY